MADFEQELEEVAEPVFVRATTLTLRLESGEAEAVKCLAKSRGVADVDLIMNGGGRRSPARESASRAGKRILGIGPESPQRGFSDTLPGAMCRATASRDQAR